MGAKDFLEAIKNFFLDFIGYFIPGFFLIVILSVTISSNYFVKTPILEAQPSMYVFVTIIITYILGYIIYGVGVLKDIALGKYSSTDKIEDKIKTRQDFTLALAKYNKHIQTNQLGQPLTANTKTRELRTLTLAFLTNDEKNLIYTFMFRSDLCKHLSNINLTIPVLAVMDFLISLWLTDLRLFLFNPSVIVLYIALFLSALLLRATRNYFYEKAIKLPFGMYLSK